jgi:ribosome-associated toxin RatA of RatAB toxin-antitoxin module
MVPHRHYAATAGRQFARRLFLLAALVAMAAGVTLAEPASAPRLEVTETGGIYTVTASFAVTEPPQMVMAVLTDYARIPKFMPGVQVSRVLERTATGAIVEQEAVSKFMLFSKRIHLVLDVREDDRTLRFRDRCGESFASYEGSWTISEHDSLTVVDYRLAASPSFEVPGFVLKRLLKRDAADLMNRITAEITNRADRRQ